MTIDQQIMIPQKHNTSVYQNNDINELHKYIKLIHEKYIK